MDDSTLKKYFNKETLKKYQMRLKVLPKEIYDSNISIEILKQNTFIFSHRHLQGIIIDNPDIARVMKQIFELVWGREDIGISKKQKKLDNT